VKRSGLVALKRSSEATSAAAADERRITGFIAIASSRANLLALNAAIKRRGPAKRQGVQVVADEVRHLAEQSANAAAEAGELVQDVHTQVGDVVEQMRRGQVNVGDVEELSAAALEALDAIVAATAEATAHAGRITAAAGEQNVAFDRLRERINAVASIAGQNRAEADDVATRAVQAAEGLTDLERATRDLEQVATMYVT
jgi:methyl-accepting chemotaxis protein